MVLKRVIQGRLNSHHVTNAHRNDSQRNFWSVLGMFQDERDDSLNLCGRALFLTIDTEFLLYEDMGKGRWTAGAGKRHESSLINVVVGEVDQTLVSASVMPVQIRAVEEGIHRIE